jgi:osmotically-inducible protein OsmY
MKLNKERLEQVLRETLEEEALDLAIDVQDDVVRLKGFIDVLGDADAALKALARQPGVRRVENQTTLGMDGYIPDKDVVAACEDTLRAHQLPVPGIAVGHGLATVTGTAQSLGEIDAVNHVLREVMGIREINNQMQVSGGRREDDASLVNEVERRLANGGADASGIDTESHEGYVTLSGSAPTLDNAELAERLARSVPGVRGVKNIIEPRE